ncbi:lipoate--protein ligase family protein [Rubinisphaera margarita]|uniref:lipoate--protein ligase family protein n=1 Tax=Rubinisphaera margarita TaxID=2909586 RepID=UPI001EE8620A|nr:hypothetical protein [Rubinisphaera margarita]MCG6155143.1 hypothetical protein [Rubinisphaera margarita]
MQTDFSTAVGSLFLEFFPRSGEENMAIDEQLLARAIDDEQISFRFYRWAEATLSLGHFQAKQRAPLAERFADLPAVTRLSGGGAILHDRELTYSLALPAAHPLAKNPTSLYAIVHTAFIAALAEQGIPVQMRGEELAAQNGEFLCFLRGDRHDVLSNGQKVLGSAQRRRKGAVLQHGSLILEASPLAPEVPGLSDLSGREVQVDSLVFGVMSRLGDLAASWENA